jgi:hypothetical protein
MNAVSAQSVGEEALLITAGGYQQLYSELESLRTRGRRELNERLREARSDGHLADNPALFDLLEEQQQLERRIAVLEGQVAAAQIVEPARKRYCRNRQLRTSARWRGRARRVRTGWRDRAQCRQRASVGRRSRRSRTCGSEGGRDSGARGTPGDDRP